MTKLLQDILREPDELLRCLEYTYGAGRPAFDAAAELLRRPEPILITGIGSSWHAGMAVETLFHQPEQPVYLCDMDRLFDQTGRPALLCDASELLHFGRIFRGSSLIVLSRSGRSGEIVNLLPEAKAAGAKIIAITNTPDSLLAQAADVTLELRAAFDHNVSVTMYSALALVGGLLAVAAQQLLTRPLVESLSTALAAVRERLEPWRQQVAASDWIAPGATTYFLGRGGGRASCHEARLLWEEAAKAPASALTTGGFRHGPQEVLEPGLRIGLWIDGERLRDADLALAADLRRLGARVMTLGQRLPADAGDLVFDLPAIPAPWQFLIDIVPAQLASEHLAGRRGADCDTFRICPYIVEDEAGLPSRPAA
jgi:glucosamine--fructose-6-phosphate aminotransferase (isomerizing)